MKFMQHVAFNRGNGKEGGHIAGDSETRDDGVKFPITPAEGGVYWAAHREPGDRDKSGSGGTFWTELEHDA